MSTEHDEVLLVLDELECFIKENKYFNLEDMLEFIHNKRSQYGDPKEYM